MDPKSNHYNNYINGDTLRRRIDVGALVWLSYTDLGSAEKVPNWSKLVDYCRGMEWDDTIKMACICRTYKLTWVCPKQWGIPQNLRLKWETNDDGQNDEEPPKL
jgi:hypothetical protein